MPFLHLPYSNTPSESGNRSYLPIRWRAFWRGSVYANPLDELFSMLQDVGARASYPAGKSYDLKIHFNEEDIVFENPDELPPTVFKYNEVLGLRFYCTPLANFYTSDTKANKLHFRTSLGEMSYPFVYDNRLLVKVFTFLLERRIPYKEYVDGTRTHLGRGDYSYRDIQALKEEWGIVW